MSRDRTMSPLSASWRDALGDNNCAFNAFILGVSQLVLEGKITDTNATLNFKKLLAEAKYIVGGKKVTDFARYLQRNSPATIQKQLQPLFRNFTIVEGLEQYRKLTQQSETIVESLFQIFDEYKVHKQARRSGYFYCEDDIFTNPYDCISSFGGVRNRLLSFVEEEFDTLISKYPTANDEDARAYIAKWWSGPGFKSFCDLMQNNGTWAGNMEVQSLAETLGMGIEIELRGHVVSKRSYGTLSLDEKQVGKSIRRLADAGLLDKNTLEWKKEALTLTPESLENLLKAVPAQKRIVRDFKKLADSQVRLDSTEAKQMLQSWSIRCKDSLVDRGILKRTPDDYQFRGGGRIEDSENNLRRLRDVTKPERVKILEFFRSHPPQEPICTLKLQNLGNHWVNTTEQTQPLILSTALRVRRMLGIGVQDYTKEVEHALEAFEFRKSQYENTEKKPYTLTPEKVEENVLTFLASAKAAEEGNLWELMKNLPDLSKKDCEELMELQQQECARARYKIGK